MTLQTYLTGRQVSDTTWKLIEMLKPFSEGDEEFMIGVLVDLKTDDEKKMLMEYIENGEGVSYESITLFSLDINITRKNKQNEPI